MTTKESEYKGHPMLDMYLDGKDKPISMGITKLKTVLANLEDVKAFIAKHTSP